MAFLRHADVCVQAQLSIVNGKTVHLPCDQIACNYCPCTLGHASHLCNTLHRALPLLSPPRTRVRVLACAQTTRPVQKTRQSFRTPGYVS